MNVGIQYYPDFGRLPNYGVSDGFLPEKWRERALIPAAVARKEGFELHMARPELSWYMTTAF